MRRGGLALVAAAAVVLTAGAYAPAGSDTTLSPEVVPMGAPEIPNPLRGQYIWIANPPDPAGWPVSDVYYRDEIQWGGQVEKQRGHYDFSMFDRGLAEAGKRGGIFGFRVMAACPGCGGTLTPGYVERQPGGQPDWNDETFLAGYTDLMKAIGARYDGDPRLGYVDVGGYGSWGEYHTYALGGDKITRENSKRLVKAVLDAFPKTFVLMMTPDAELLRDAMELSPRLGIRVDCVGDGGFKGSRIDDVPPALERWKTAPWVGEWCGGSDADNQYELGLQQVRKYHIAALSSANFPERAAAMSPSRRTAFEKANKESGYRFVLSSMTLGPAVAGAPLTVTTSWSNVGVAPAYLPWNTTIELRDPRSDVVVFAGRSAVDLATMLPTGDKPVEVKDTFTLPATVPAGSYDVHVRVTSPRNYPGPLRLAITGREQDGSYRLGALTVTRSGTQVLAPAPVAVAGAAS
jgi:hypothetical protein